MMAVTALVAGALWAPAVYAGSVQVVDVEDATPFIGYAGAFYSGGTIATVSYAIQPMSGSVTRPFSAKYSANYLNTNNYFIPGANAVIIPIFGLYSGASNTVAITYTFTDGTSSVQTVTINTPAYSDPCAQVNQRTTIPGLRQSTASLNFDYFILKDYCSSHAPAIVDTDANIRWVGSDAAVDGAINFFNNAFYYSDGGTGIIKANITNGAASKLADYASIGVTFTGHHNIDPGRKGLILDVNTTTQTEATNIEIDPNTGAVLNEWDLGAIISAAMTAGGDNPANFVLGTTADWFHNNATAYNPADNTLIVSSRENFVMAVDYDAPASGQRKIHWILGDTTKAWYAYPSLRQYALTMANGSTLAPIGQHAVSIDHQGNVLLFDDGLGSLTQNPAGQSRNYSAARAYQINTTTMTANETFTFTAANAGQNLFSPICGSAYDVGGTYLVDFTTANANAAAAVQANETPGAVVGILTAPNATTANVVVGVGNANALQFVMALPSPGPCVTGWNSLPFATNVFTFN